MNKKIVYSFDKEGKYVGESTAWESPLEPGIFLIPASSTEIKPNFQEGMITKWNGNEWILEPAQIPPLPEPEPLSLEERKQSLKNQLLSPRKSYLSKTDQYCLKEFDLPGTYPKDIKIKRIQAWKEIDTIEAATSLKILNEFTPTFEQS